MREVGAMKHAVHALLVLAVLGAAAAFGPRVGAAGGEVPYPEGYRGWRHVKSMVIGAGHPLFEAFGGLHHLYANEKALEGYRSGVYPDGAVIVFDLREADAAGGAIVAGKRKVVGVMHRDRAAFAATGGWGFEGFAGESKTARAVADKAATACFQCHQAQQSQEYVFSRYEE
jgi:hypothetical protein